MTWVTLSFYTHFRLVQGNAVQLLYNLSAVLTYRLADSRHINTKDSKQTKNLGLSFCSNQTSHLHTSSTTRAGQGTNLSTILQMDCSDLPCLHTQLCYLQPNLKVKLDFDTVGLVNVLSGSTGSQNPSPLTH